MMSLHVTALSVGPTLEDSNLVFRFSMTSVYWFGQCFGLTQ